MASNQMNGDNVIAMEVDQIVDDDINNHQKMMASTSKGSSSPIKKDKPISLNCVNRFCTQKNKTLVPVVQMVCMYYRVRYKPHKRVCTVCFKKCTIHTKNLEKRMRSGKCIMNGHFPNYDKCLVINSSDDDFDGDDDNEIEKPKPTALKVDSSTNEEVIAGLNYMVQNVFEQNKDLIEQQNELCYTYLKSKIVCCEKMAVDIDALVLDADDTIKYLRESLYGPYRPNRIELDPVDLDELEKKEAIEAEISRKNAIAVNRSANVCPADVPKEEPLEYPYKPVITELNPVDLDELKKEEPNKTAIDKDVIAVNRTVCIIPSDLPKEGPLEYSPLKDGQFVYAMKMSLIEPWYKGKLRAVLNNDYVHIKFDSGEKLLSKKQIAFYPPNSVRFPVGSRVIAKFTDSDCKVDDYFYAGIIAEPPTLINLFRYMIFFDDGYVQYRDHKDIRLIVHKSNKVWNDVHPDSKDFIKNYLRNYPERQMVRLTKNNFVKVEHENQWHSAKVLEVDASMVKLLFKNLKQCEWLYRGSSRLWNIYEKQTKSEKGIRLRQSGLAYLNKPFVEYTRIEEEPTIHKSGVARKITNKLKSSDKTIKPNKTYNNCNDAFNAITLELPKIVFWPRQYFKHYCNISCIDWTGYNYNKTAQINILAIPLHFGFNRCLAYFNDHQKCVWYITPCGRTIRNIKEMHDFLIATNSSMTIELFDFSSWVKPLSEHKVLKTIKFIKDLSAGKEFRAITCVNNINNELPPPMEYVTVRQPMSGVNINVDGNFLCGCDCIDNCQDKSKCACWKMTIEGQKNLPNLYKDPNIGYSYRRLPERVLTGIYECNKTCKCSNLCLNRVVQQPLSQNLQLFLTEKKGWGVRCLNDIPQGGFICIYVGYLLTETDANEGGKNYGDEYLAELDYIEVAEKIKEDYESDVVPSDQEDTGSKRNDNRCVTSEFSDDDYQTSEGSNVVSDIFSRLRKRKKTKKHTKSKKNGQHVHVLSRVYTRDMKNNPKPPKSVREYFGDNESVYIMDAKTSGNIGRYLNHSCNPNTFVQNVFVDTHDLRFPWVSFFALHYIEAGTELTWDYSYDVGSVPGKKMQCRCESSNCRGRLL